VNRDGFVPSLFFQGRFFVLQDFFFHDAKIQNLTIKALALLAVSDYNILEQIL